MEYVVYYRVSTNRQDYGIDAQREAVGRYLKTHPGAVLAEYAEHESATRKKRHRRAELTKAVNHAKSAKATLLIAKMDRLTRSVSTLTEILDAGVEVCAADMPSISRMVMIILAAVAEEEARLISVRTKDALAEARKRGIVGGRRPGAKLNVDSVEACAESARVRQQKAREHYSTTAALLEAWSELGISQYEMAKRLNASGHKTRFGKPWRTAQVGRALRALAA